MKFNMRSKKFFSMMLVFFTIFSFSSSIFASNDSFKSIDGIISTSKIDELNESIKKLDENASEITHIKKIVKEDGSEEFIVEFQLTSLNATAKGIGFGSAHFSRTSKMNQWECYFTINLFESIISADYQLHWGIGNYFNFSDFSGLGTNTAISGTHRNIYSQAGVYKPTCSIQVWGASGPYGTIAVPNINTIVILLDLN